MYQILQAKELTTNIFMMVVEAKRVAKSCEPGQFVIVRRDADSERIPLTICDYDREAGTILPGVRKASGKVTGRIVYEMSQMWK